MTEFQTLCDKGKLYISDIIQQHREAANTFVVMHKHTVHNQSKISQMATQINHLGINKSISTSYSIKVVPVDTIIDDAFVSWHFKP